MTTALILDAGGRLRDLADAAVAALAPLLQARGHEVVRRDLTALSIPDCKGDFGCWTVTPGICVQPGPHRELAQEMIRSDLLVLLGPVTFGGYASAIKRAIDHGLPLISNWFTTVDGETHHRRRYPRFPALLAVGLEEVADPEAEAIFERLVRRNALNLSPRGHAAGFLARATLRERAVDAAAARWLAALDASTPPRARAAPLDLSHSPALPARQARRVLLLTGTPRGPAGLSTGLARHVEGLLSPRGLEVETVSLHAALREDPTLRGLSARVRAADAVALFTPLYVDCLPGPVTASLEALAAERREDSAQPAANERPRLLAVVNCGFPESVHDDTGLAICRRFAAEAGLEWMGGLAIGGGGVYGGRPLAEQGGRARHLLTAFELAADAIARGTELPAEAERLARRLPVPAWLYRWIGDLGFWLERRRRGTLSRREAQPYA